MRPDGKSTGKKDGKLMRVKIPGESQTTGKMQDLWSKCRMTFKSDMIRMMNDG